MKWAIAAAVSLGIFFVVGILLVPGQIFIDQLQKTCGGCHVVAIQADFRLFPLRWEAEGLSFRQGRPELSAFDVNADKVVLPFSLRSLWGPLTLGKIQVDGVRFELVEGDEISARSPSQNPSIRWEGVEIRRGEFRYRRMYPGRDAVLTVREIDANIGALDGTEPFHLVLAEAKAKLENSGVVDLKIETRFFSPEPDVLVKLLVEKQKLAELNQFFTASDQLRLKGILARANASLEVKGKTQDAWVELTYDRFDVVFASGRERSPTEAFFANLLKGFKLDDGNKDEPRKERRRSVRLQSKKTESVVSFLIRGLMQAALGIATS